MVKKRSFKLDMVKSIINFSDSGYYLLIYDKEYFIPFSDYPVFRKANIEQIFDFHILPLKQIYWKPLDCDIEQDALEKPQQFKLIYK
jgi:hypothetical protein